MTFPQGRSTNIKCICSLGDQREYLISQMASIFQYDMIFSFVPSTVNTVLSKHSSENTETILNRVHSVKEKYEKNVDFVFLNNLKLNETCLAILKSAMSKLTLDPYRLFIIKHVSYTISLMDGSKNIQPEHIAEAVQYLTVEDELYSIVKY